MTTTEPRATVPPLTAYAPAHVALAVERGIATLTLNRPERKNPLTFDSYAELVGIFRAARSDESVKVFVLSGAGGNFSSGGDVFEIIGPLVAMKTKDLLRFTALTGDLVKAMRACPQPVIAAVDGVCAGAGAIMAMASDMRLATPAAKVAFLFNRVGLAGCDMGACAILPRLIGQGRASELLLVEASDLMAAAHDLARSIAEGPTFATGLTKRMLHMEWAMGVDDAIEAEAVAQALCMKTEDFGRAYRAFAGKTKPVFQGD